MSLVSMHPLEAILRLCADAAPHPWFPREYAQATGVSMRQLSQLLELLYLDGLIQRAPGTSGAEAGFLLSPAGQQVLDDPEALRRLRDGEPTDPGDRGAVIRQALRGPARPVVMRLLLAANLLVFGYGAYLAFTQQPPVTAYLDLMPVGNGPVAVLLHRIGSVSALDIVQGEWWRLLTACFVHIGVLHLLMNMYVLYAAGRMAEAMWGHWRFLVIYLLSGLGGSCLGVAFKAGGVAGASGALCGIIAAEAVWVLLNGRYLPRSLASRWRGGLLTTLLLIIFISMMPNISAAGHLGGALAGGAAALLLNCHRFGSAPWRWLALAGLAGIPWASLAVLDRVRTTSAAWHLVEETDFEQRFLSSAHPLNVRKTLSQANWYYQTEIRVLLDIRPERREPEAIERALASLAEQQQALNRLAEALTRAGPYHSPVAEEARQAGLNYVRARAGVFTMAERCLREGDQWTAEDEKARKEQIDQEVKARRAWEDLLQR